MPTITYQRFDLVGCIFYSSELEKTLVFVASWVSVLVESLRI